MFDRLQSGPAQPTQEDLIDIHARTDLLTPGSLTHGNYANDT
jgi:hypothetical protein